jgi:hypothetical protein
VLSSNTKIYRTHTHKLYVSGTGFPTAITKPKLKFNLPLEEQA